MRSATVLVDEMLRYAYAVGHVQAGSENPTVPPRVVMRRSGAPAGSLTSATAREVLRFVRCHFDLGRAPSGRQVLSAESVQLMQQPQAKMHPGVPLGSHVGLSWLLDEWDGERVIGHGGSTIGQNSFLQSLPERRFAVCLLTNSDMGGALWRPLAEYLFDEFAGVRLPPAPKPPSVAPKVDLGNYAGHYERYGAAIDVKVVDRQLEMTMTPTGSLAAMGNPPITVTLTPLDAEVFFASMPRGETVVGFTNFDRDGRPAYVLSGGRATRRAAERKTPAKKSTTATRPPAKKSTKKRAGTRTRSR